MVSKFLFFSCLYSVLILFVNYKNFLKIFFGNVYFGCSGRAVRSNRDISTKLIIISNA